MTREERKHQRASWPVRRFRLGEEPVVDSYVSLTPEERVTVAWELSRRACHIARMPTAEYTRATMPGILRRIA